MCGLEVTKEDLEKKKVMQKKNYICDRCRVPTCVGATVPAHVGVSCGRAHVCVSACGWAAESALLQHTHTDIHTHTHTLSLSHTHKHAHVLAYKHKHKHAYRCAILLSIIS